MKRNETLRKRWRFWKVTTVRALKISCLSFLMKFELWTFGCVHVCDCHNSFLTRNFLAGKNWSRLTLSSSLPFSMCRKGTKSVFEARRCGCSFPGCVSYLNVFWTFHKFDIMLRAIICGNLQNLQTLASLFWSSFTRSLMETKWTLGFFTQWVARKEDLPKGFNREIPFAGKTHAKRNERVGLGSFPVIFTQTELFYFSQRAQLRKRRLYSKILGITYPHILNKLVKPNLPIFRLPTTHPAHNIYDPGMSSAPHKLLLRENELICRPPKWPSEVVELFVSRPKKGF